MNFSKTEAIALFLDLLWTIEKPLDALLEYLVSTEKMVCLFTFLVYRKLSANLYAGKFDGLLVNNNKIVN